MGFLTRLIAGLVAASTLGAGLAGTAGAVDTTGTTGDAKGVVKLASDDTSGLPDHLVNGDFEYPGANVLSKNRYDEKDANWWGVSRKDKMVYDPSHETQWVSLPSTFDSDRFAWDSTEVAGVQNGSSQWHTNEVELQRDSRTGNMYGELCAYQANTSIRQYIRTTPGVLYKVRLKHASLSRDYLDKMQVLIGSDGNEQPVSMTRVESQNGLDATGASTASTTVSTHASNEEDVSNGLHSSRNHDGQWATYEGVYVATSDMTSFTFRSVDARSFNLGNLLDDIVFDKAYRLSYDKNSTAASGQVPSNERGRENTVQPAKAKTTGTVKTVADENVRYGSLANGDFSYPSFSDIQKNEQEGYADLRTFLKSDDGTLWYNMSATDLSKYGKIGQIPGFDSSRFAWSSTENGSRVELQQDRNTKNTYAEIVAQQDNTSIYQNVSTGNGGVLYKIRLKHASRQSSHVDRMQVLVGSDTDHATPVEMTRVTSNGHGDKVGGKSTIITTKVSNTDPRDHGAQWETYEGYYQVPEGQKNTVFMFKSLEGFKEDETLPGNNIGNLVDDIEFSRSYKLTYDANSSDASGQVPSDTAANTVKQAKSKTNGSVRLAADDDVAEYAANGLPKQIMNGDFDHDWRNIVSQSKMTDKYNFANVDPAHGDVEISGGLNSKGEASKQWVHLNGFDAAKFGWKSNQTDTRVDGRGGIVEIQRSKANDNMYAEITASQADTYLYQDIDTAHSVPTVYTVKLRYAHRNGTVDSNEKIQILVGAPGHEQPVEMTRIASDRGNKVGEKSTTVNAPNTDGWLGSWDTFQGSVEIPAGQPVSRFTFKALGSIDGVTGNLIDDVQFQLAYPLTYDKNAGDATGSVPSSQYGKENTIQPAASKTNGTVKTVADGDSSKSLTVNPGFDVPDYSKLDDGGLHWMYVSPAEGEAWSFYDYINPAQPRHQVAGLSQATFGWQELTGGDHKTTSFELHREKDGNVCADVHGSRTIGQTIDTQAGVAYTVSIRHSGRSKGNAGSVQVLVGPDKDHLRPLEMSRMNVSRTGAKYGDRIGKVGTVVTTHSDSVDSTEGNHPAWDHSDDWETYSGTYVATGGKTVFAYRGVDKNGNAVSGTDSAADSVIDDLSFKLAYPLVYDKNAQDATGSVPSSQYGKENTVEPAEAKTTGSVRLAADKTASGLTVHDLEMNDVPADYRQFMLNTTDTRLSQVEFEDGAWYKSTDPSSQGMWPLRIGASLTIPSVGDWTDPSGKTHQISMTMRLKDWNGGSVSELYRFDGHGNIVGDGRFWVNTAYGSGYSSLPAKVKAAMGGVDTSKRVGCSWTVEFTYAGTGEKVPDTFKGVTGFNDLDGWDAQSDLKFEGVQLLSGFDGAYKRSDAELGTYGTNGFAGIGHDAGDEAHLNAPQQSRHRLAATWTGSAFTFSYDLSNPAGRTDGSRMTFGAPVTRTAVLTYDKNAADASGQVPSNTTPDTTQTASSKSTGKVSDLVQRTTTHEDGSVTVRTVDQSTDVVSGCQVYYPAGQRITLATLAKDGDCWDSSMLTRPGHTQLGWSQDSQATQAQAEVTMVEGGMTVYAVWVGNPVLTYDTNKPNTWNGQMPSTPASVSVSYNTAAADGSGWQSGDTSKIRGYRFLGWYAGPQDDSGLYDWNTLLTGNVTVYAHWQRLQANVVYDANGGTGSHANTTGWQYSDATVPSDTSKSFKRAGYVFLGWDTQADGNGTAYKDGSQVPLQDKDITLYAQWQPVFEQFTPTGGVSLPLLVAGGVTLLVMGIGSTVMLTRRMRGEQ
ncbi:InlB B-repeat-containing protein [Bifidobacterium pseudocatenulatum]|uniref:InlB B-repeat-containing protein n=1 Tax=Bifidobacterium pseudocatenulatum TaxID=28026 RepID=UPI001ADD414D|nr:InlB B-repeat-containing protein [Bifidobacterium pseudocatenulatum]QTL80931.1 InlB B-repeat-containing protein [Bifidobacterium pseudocatenulatum]